jgi:TonB family protein
VERWVFESLPRDEMTRRSATDSLLARAAVWFIVSVMRSAPVAAAIIAFLGVALPGCTTAPEAATVRPPSGAETAQPFSEAFDIGKLETMPQIIFQAQPSYPIVLQRANVSGEALVDFIVDVSGNVRDAYAARATHPFFAKAAVECVVQWKFRPGMVAGRAVNTHMQVPIVFTLN